PVQPSDSIMEALRLASQERRTIEFVDLETPVYQPEEIILPDEYAVRFLGLKKYYEVIAEQLQPNTSPQSDQRERWMAYQLKRLSSNYEKVLFICGLFHLRGIQKYFLQKQIPIKDLQEIATPNYRITSYQIQSESLYFLNGEIPYLTYLYERSRYSLTLEEYDQTDGIKELLVETRNEFVKENPEETYFLGAGNLQVLIKFVRNLCLQQNRLTPGMYDLIVGAKGVGGDSFAHKLIEMAKFYPYLDPTAELPQLPLTPRGARLPDTGEETKLTNRLEGPPIVWKNIKLERKPSKKKRAKWAHQWGQGQCSWPDEDEKIENFTAYVRKKAMNLLGEDLIRVEKFQTSLKDGLDLRETLRNWHKQEIYVKEIPVVKGEIGAVIFIFEEDPEGTKYPWKITWLAEHDNESTLCFYATDYKKDIIGPGIGRAKYGGSMFLFPPLQISDIFLDPKFKQARNSMEHLVAAAIYYSRNQYLAYVSHRKPTLWMKREAAKANKHLIYIPLASFGQLTLRKLRTFHVLNGQHIRSYARDYIR
ncbi:MAG: hypothetical protein AABZ60_15800, partial [Planctomycetota bacterium]